MRRRAVVVVAVLLLSCSVVFAQSNRISVYATNPGVISGDLFGTHYTGGGGVSLNHFWTSRWSTEIAAGAERDYQRYVAFNRDGSIRDKQEFGFTTYPIELLAEYHFRTESRAKPYIGAGVRYANRPDRYLTGSTFAAELNGGVFLALKPRFGVLFDGRISDSGTRWFPRFRPSVGVSWRF